jgi:hypothetical protein
VIAAGPARDSGHLTTGRGGAREQQRKRGGRNISGGIVENAGETATPAVGFLATKRGRDILGVGWQWGWGCKFAEVGTARAWDPHVSWRQGGTVSQDCGHRWPVPSARGAGATAPCRFAPRDAAGTGSNSQRFSCIRTRNDSL